MGNLKKADAQGLRPSFLRCAYAAKVSNEPKLSVFGVAANGRYPSALMLT
jgi:hypothetical protein